MYKEVALSRLTHNGKEYQKGDTVRERVPLSGIDVRVLTETPELTNCKYIEIEAKPEVKEVKAEEPKPEVKAEPVQVKAEPKPEPTGPDLTTNTNFKGIAELTRIAKTLNLKFKEGELKKNMTVAIDNRRNQIKAQQNAAE